MLAEVFDHIVALIFAVHEYVQSQFLLKLDAALDFIPDKGFILRSGYLSGAQFLARGLDLLRLREGADRCGGE